MSVHSALSTPPGADLVSPAVVFQNVHRLFVVFNAHFRRCITSEVLVSVEDAAVVTGVRKVGRL